MKLEICNLKKSYNSGDELIPILKGVNASFEDGKIYSIVGASGSGKSTLLYIMSLLEDRDEGDIVLDGISLPKVNYHLDREITEIRKKNFAFIFQFFNLMNSLSVEDNLRLSYQILGRNDFDKEWMVELLQKVGLLDKKNKIVYELSGGEKQRVAVVRALMDYGSIVFADEPTGNLDKRNTEIISGLLQSLAKEYKKSVIMVTHDQDVANISDEIWKLEDGLLVREN